MTARAQAESRPNDTPEPPVVTISAGRERLAAAAREIWRYRELLYFLAWRDVKVRYRQTLLGIAWAILQPLLTMVLFALFFGKLARMPSDGIPYALFAYAGLLPWTFFASAVTNAADSVVTNPDLVTKVYLPRLLVPCAAIGAPLLDFAVAFGVLAALMAFYRASIGPSLAALPGLVVLTAMLAGAVGIFLAALNVKYRDVRYALPFAIQLWMFASPVIYPSSIVPLRWRPLLMLNPLTGIIEGFRSALFGRPFDWPSLAASAFITAAILVYAAQMFQRSGSDFADVI